MRNSHVAFYVGPRVSDQGLAYGKKLHATSCDQHDPEGLRDAWGYVHIYIYTHMWAFLCFGFRDQFEYVRLLTAD